MKVAPFPEHSYLGGVLPVTYSAESTVSRRLPLSRQRTGLRTISGRFTDREWSCLLFSAGDSAISREWIHHACFSRQTRTDFRDEALSAHSGRIYAVDEAFFRVLNPITRISFHRDIPCREIEEA